MEVTEYLRFVLALALVLALIGLFALLLRRFGPMAGVPVRRGADRRLSIVEVMVVDARRRLVLVRRDDVEHLLLIGISEDLVVERDIRGGGKPAFADALSRAGSATPPEGPAP